MFIQDAISDWIDPSLPGVDLPADDECILYKDANWGGDQISFRLGGQSELQDSLFNYEGGFGDEISSF